MLSEVFKDIRDNKRSFLNSSTGEEFENRIRTSLTKNRYREVYQDQFDKKTYNQIKEKVNDKCREEVVDNFLDKVEFGNCFIYQPFGSQNFPDFLVFTEKHIIAVEIKYSRNKSQRPMWNSNLPKANAIYIFGSYGLNDIMFFVGKDILPHEERVRLIQFFEKVKKIEDDFKIETKNLFIEGKVKSEKGFMVYIRRAYEQNRKTNDNAEINYFDFKNRKQLEDNVIAFCNQYL